VRYRPSAEIIIVTAIVLLLLCLAAPYMLSRRDQARRQQHLDKFRQLGQSLQSYHDTHQRFPSVASPARKPAVSPREQPEELISPL
jgi:type II secretory pathway pseudopilin PulG